MSTVAESNNKDNPAQQTQVVFSTPARYDAVTVALVSFAPLCLLVTLFIMIAMDANDYYSGSQGKTLNLVVMVISLLAVLLLFAVVLPHHYEIHQSQEEATLVVVTNIPKLQYKFPHITAALENPSILQPCGSRGRLKFATSMQDRILVRRLVQGSWDILVSPEDTQGFVQAVFASAAAVEEAEASQQRIVAFGSDSAKKAAMQLS
mmetsp:Transcript_3784/g.10404  ORF Transcript_3784/g.10404 Transcript_3784/m.10404 type:complete len:206 (-) Transcript_3784:210-827(-)